MKARTFPESRMSPIVSAWIAAQGYTVFAEVPCGGRCIDLVGVRWSDESMLAVELKTCLRHGVLHQAHCNAIATPLTYAAVSSRPRSLNGAETYRVGVLLVGETVEVVRTPDSRAQPFKPYREQILRYCRVAEPGGTAGMPTVAGVGPAQEVYDAVQKYRAENPGAKWHDVFLAVPNQYCSAKSMQGGMRMVRDHRAWRERKLAAAQ